MSAATIREDLLGRDYHQRQRLLAQSGQRGLLLDPANGWPTWNGANSEHPSARVLRRSGTHAPSGRLQVIQTTVERTPEPV
ncbi:MAG: hypothetical protein U0Q18_06040 [Bryobacteraceae bacterium]